MPEFRDRKHAMDLGHVGNPLDHSMGFGVDDDHLTVAQVGDKQQLTICINARIIKTRCTPAERDIHQRLKTKRRRQGSGVRGHIRSQRQYERGDRHI